MRRYFWLAAGFLAVTGGILVDSSWSADWPMWRKDAARAARTSERLPTSLTLHWTRQLPTPQPAWPAEQGKVRFDVSYEPIVVGDRLVIGSMVRDCVTAFHVSDGQLLWRFYAGGPVRFAPVACGNHLLFASDDGFLYCLDIRDGSLIWKFRGGPSDRKLLGNDRLVSMWPARGGPVVVGQTVYFAAGIWPFMGTFIHALDVETGQVIWTNSGSGSRYIVQQHNSPAFAGVAPQGYLAVAGDTLLVSGGMTVPAAYDRRTGEFLYYRPGDRDFGKDFGGYAVVAGTDWFANRGGLYRLTDGQPLAPLNVVSCSAEQVFGTAGQQLVALEPQLTTSEVAKVDRQGRSTKKREQTLSEVWRTRLPDPVRQIHLQAAHWLLAADQSSGIYALDVTHPTKHGQTAAECRIAWSDQIQGQVWTMVVANQRLFVVNTEGTVFCFGAAENQPSSIRKWQEPLARASKESDVAPLPEYVRAVLRDLSVQPGYAVLDGRQIDLVPGLLAESQLHVILMEPRAATRHELRQRLDEAQLLGRRVAVMAGDPSDGTLPMYMANLMMMTFDGDLDADATAEAARTMAQVLRPYGGTAVLRGTRGQCDAVTEALGASADADEDQLAAQIQLATNPPTESVVFRRPGPLPGAGAWTHQNGDAGNTLVSQDIHPKTPLGLLWFGGPPNRGVLPRHGHGPTPQIVGGRLYIEGRDMLRAVDVYTGRLLWQRPFKDVGLYHDITYHHPGAGAIGGNFVCTPDAVYLVWQRKCLRLDPATGDPVAEFQLPPDASGQQPYWGHIAVHDDVLVAGSSPMVLLSERRESSREDKPIYTRFGEGSQRIVVMDRHDGNVLWKRDAKFNFRHNAIAVGEGKLFCLDRMTPQRLASLARRGRVPDGEFCLYGLDLRTGDVLWQSTEHAFGTWLAYNDRNRLLLQAGSRNRDRATDEVGHGISVHQAETGELLWRNEAEYGGPPLFYPRTIIMQGTAFDLADGQLKQRQHPLTDEPLPWKFARNYGCNTAIGCSNLLTFRSAAAGYFDLANDGGTGNLGGFRTGCTANLIAADGVLNAPDYTRTCTCSYQHQCSVALVHMPEVEMWTFNPIRSGADPVKRVGINFGAPGDRRAANGVLWLDYPSVGGPSPDVPVQVAGQTLDYVRRHNSTIDAGELDWIYASGVRNAGQIEIRTAPQDVTVSLRPHCVRLFFCQPSHLAERPVQVRIRLQGQVVAEQFDVLEAAGGYDRGAVLRLDPVLISDTLELTFEPVDDASQDASLPVLCGVEITRQTTAGTPDELEMQPMDARN